MHYPAIITREGRHTLAEFPDCLGCQTFAEPGDDLVALAQDALAGWLEVHLEDGHAPPQPSARVRTPKGARSIRVPVPPKLAVALSVRWARQAAELSQADLARRMGVSQQQAAKLENPATNPTIETLAKLAAALGVEVDVAFVQCRSA